MIVVSILPVLMGAQGTIFVIEDKLRLQRRPFPTMSSEGVKTQCHRSLSHLPRILIKSKPTTSPADAKASVASVGVL